MKNRPLCFIILVLMNIFTYMFYSKKLHSNKVDMKVTKKLKESLSLLQLN
jgi:hypothetical protein